MNMCHQRPFPICGNSIAKYTHNPGGEPKHTNTKTGLITSLLWNLCKLSHNRRGWGIIKILMCEQTRTSRVVELGLLEKNYFDKVVWGRAGLFKSKTETLLSKL